MKKYLFLIFLFSSLLIYGQNYNMTNSSISTCSGIFYDNGGASNNYSNNLNLTQTFCSNVAGQSIQLNFSAFNIENNWDFMYIYNGPNTGSPLIGTFTGTNSPGLVISAGSCITIVFTSDVIINAPGWAASISCVNPPPPVPCTTCETACSACGFATAPTVNQVTNNCPDYPYTPNLTAGQTSTRCHTFTAVNTTVSFNVIINSTCQNGNVTNFSWNLQNASCGGIIQSGTLSNLNFTNLIVGQTYTFCYTFSVPTGCYHTAHWPYFVGACNTEPPLVVNASRCGPGTVTLTASGCSGGTINWYSSASGGTPIATGSTFTTPSISATTTYYASCNISPCESARVPVVASVAPNVTPTFNPVGPYCSGATIPALPTTSNNGITGTWSPAINNTATTTYTFTPTAGLCASTTTLSLTITTPPAVTVNSPTVCSGNTATITATPTPAGTYTYAWTVPSGATNPGNVASFSTSTAGTYTVTVSTTTTPSCPSAPASGTLTITQPPAPTGLACYQTATWNATTCVWDVTGTQPAAPTGLACYQTATWNPTTCVWDVTGSQPAQPTVLCYETATWNPTTCVWDVTGSQPAQPTVLCYETATWNATTCVWDVTGSQPSQPTVLCYETATWNATTCVLDVTGSQPAQPTVLCY